MIKNSSGWKEQAGFWFPLFVFTLILSVLAVLRTVFGMVAPLWGRWALGILWGCVAFGYLVRMQLLKRLGGGLVLFSATLILVTMLLPRDDLEAYYRQVTERAPDQVESVWDRIYGEDISRDSTFRDVLRHAAGRMARMDIYLAGQVIAFALLTLALSLCFLFPEDPYVPRRYVRAVGLVAGGALFFALHAELLQALSPTREVVLLGVLESAAGIAMGLALFLAIHAGWALLRGRRAPDSMRFNVLGVGVDAVDMDECISLFERIIEGNDVANGASCGVPGGGGHPVMTSALGVAGIVEARRNPTLQRILNQSVLNTPDGMPLVWLGQLFGYRNIRRVYGPDLLRDVCAYSASRGWRHFFYGAAPGVVEKLKAQLERKHPDIQIAGVFCPPFRPLTEEEEHVLIEQVREAKPDIFWIGISTPKQLYFMDQMRDKLDCKIICPVGYAFDVNAGVEQDAPVWIKYSGFQWLHRAIKQPRLWKRYLPDNPRFLFEMFLQILHLKKYPMFIHERPRRPFIDSEGVTRFPVGPVSLSAMTLDQARDRVLNWVATGKRHYVNVCTADTVVQCFDRPELAAIVEGAGMAATDGMPLVWMARRYGLRQARRVYGPDLMLAICEATATLNQRTEDRGQRLETTRDQTSEVSGQISDGKDLIVDLRPPVSEKKCIKHFFYGATDEVLKQLKENLLVKFPGLEIAGMYSPPFRPLTEPEKEDVARLINASGADIVWCGLGTPKQDYWIAEFRPKLRCAAILAVGAAFNFHAGEVRQAPRWMMGCGLEWLFRLYVEPRRLWRRYLIGNPRFVLMVARQFGVAKPRHVVSGE